MTEDIDVAVETEDDTYIPQAAFLAEGETLIGDPVELFAMTNALAVESRDGNLYILDRDTLKWCAIDQLGKSKPVAALSAIKGGDA